MKTAVKENTCSEVSNLCRDLLKQAKLHGGQIDFKSCWRELGGEQFRAAECGTQLVLQTGTGLSASFKTRIAGEKTSF